jgi:pyruvate/2-oxoglutarate dehydrogenase complex dihydrolipoamide dehydrogenase (E3) component
VKVKGDNLPIKIEKIDEKLNVHYQNQITKEVIQESFDTVLLAVGRTPNT